MPTAKNEILLKLIYQEENKRVMDDAVASFKKMSEAQKKAFVDAEKLASGSSRLTGKLSKLSGVARDLRGAGGFLGNDTLIAIGNVADGFSDIGGSVDGVVKKMGGLSGVIKNLPGVGAIALQVGQLIKVLEKVPEAAGGLINPTAQTKQSLLQDTDRWKRAITEGSQTGGNIIAIAQMITEAQKITLNTENATIDANNAVFDFKRALQKNPEAINKTIGDLMGGVGMLLGPAGGQIGKYAGAASSTAADQAAKAQGEKIAQGLLDYTRRAGGVASSFGNLQAASKTFETRRGGAAMAYRNALDYIAQETSAKRLEYAKAYNSDIVKLDQQYYAQRTALAQQYGAEAQRAEEDHQRNIARMTKDHDKRMSRLSEQRDALGIADEIDNFNDQKQQAEEDYQVMARRRSEDYANQLRELERAHQEQINERREAYNQQLADLQAYAAQRRNQEALEYGKLLQDIVQAFTDARNAFASQMAGSNTNTTTNNASVTQNFNGSMPITPDLIRQETYNAISAVMREASR